jgi:hypothetical protein
MGRAARTTPQIKPPLFLASPGRNQDLKKEEEGRRKKEEEGR